MVGLDVELSAGFIVNVASSALLLGLALLVMLVRPHRAANLWFAVFSAAFGLRFIGSNVIREFDMDGAPADVVNYSTAAASLLGAVAAIRVALLFPQPLPPSERALRRWPALVGILLTLVAVATLFDQGEMTADFASHLRRGDGFGGFLATGSLYALVGALYFGLFLFATRFARTTQEEARYRRQYGLLTAALLFYLGFVAGAGYFTDSSILTGQRPYVVQGAAAVLALVVLSGMWLHNTRVAPDSKISRNVALLCLAAPLGGLLYARFVDGIAGYGISRTLGVIVFGYAIIRHQLFDIDFKIKWTLRRGSLAAFFLIIFVAGTQVAQNYFNAEAGILWGGLVTGLFFFAITPLQKLAERVANAAMPNVKEPGTAGKNRETYQAALEMALADGLVSRAEERALAKIAVNCGIDPQTALELREEAEQRAGIPAPVDVRPRPSPPLRRG